MNEHGEVTQNEMLTGLDISKMSVNDVLFHELSMIPISENDIFMEYFSGVPVSGDLIARMKGGYFVP